MILGKQKERITERMKEIWEMFVTNVKEIIANADTILLAVIKLALVVIAARVLISIVNKLIHRWMERKAKKHPGSTYEKKQHTISTLLQSVTKYVIYFFMVVAILEVIGMGETVTSVIAAAGIGGVALGLGAQSFISDVVAGFFNLFEDSFAVGDYIRLPNADLQGVVESFSLRTTRIKLANGQTAIVTNGALGTIINYTRNGYTLVLDYAIAADEDDEKAEKLLVEKVRAYMKEKDYVPETVNYVGIAAFNSVKKTLRITLEVPPMQQWQAERDINKIVMDAFVKEGIRMPEYQDKIGVKTV